MSDQSAGPRRAVPKPIPGPPVDRGLAETIAWYGLGYLVVCVAVTAVVCALALVP